MLDWKSDWKSNQTSDWKLVLMLDQMLDRMYTNWLYCLDEKKRTGVKWTFKKKHCQRHNGPRVLSLKLEWSLKLKWIQIQFSQKGNSSYRLNTLGALCLWQCCFTSDLYFIWMNNNPICSKGLFRWPSLALVPILGKPVSPETDEFPENFRTAFDPPPRPFFGKFHCDFFRKPDKKSCF